MGTGLLCQSGCWKEQLQCPVVERQRKVEWGGEDVQLDGGRVLHGLLGCSTWLPAPGIVLVQSWYRTHRGSSCLVGSMAVSAMFPHCAETSGQVNCVSM